MYLIFLVCLFSAQSALHAAPKLVDEIVAQIYHPEGNDIILYSDLVAGIDGQRKTLRDIVLERLMVLDAKKYKIEVTDEELDRYLAQMLKTNSWSRNDFIMFLDENGLSYEEGRDMLRSRQMMNQVLDYRVRADKRMMVDRKEAYAFYKEHPEVEEATYTLSIAYAPFSAYPAEKLDAMLAQKEVPANLEWDEPFTLKSSELAQDRQFIAEREVGSIVLVDKLEDGYELTKLVEKTPAKEIPFDDVYHKIVNDMRKERFEQVLHDYHASLLDPKKTHVKIYREGLSIEK